MSNSFCFNMSQVHGGKIQIMISTACYSPFLENHSAWQCNKCPEKSCSKQTYSTHNFQNLLHHGNLPPILGPSPPGHALPTTILLSQCLVEHTLGKTEIELVNSAQLKPELIGFMTPSHSKQLTRLEQGHVVKRRPHCKQPDSLLKALNILWIAHRWQQNPSEPSTHSRSL